MYGKKGDIQEQARYCIDTMERISERAARYGDFIDENGYSPIAGSSLWKNEVSATALRRMITQLRQELLVLGKML